MTGLVLPVSGSIAEARGLALPLPFWPAAPAILTRRSGGDREPPDPTDMQAEIHRQPLAVAPDWQAEAVRLWREHRDLDPVFVDRLDAAGILGRCVVLSTDDNGQLAFRRIGEPTVRFFGRDWAAGRLGRPHIEDPFSVFAQQIDAEYRAAIDGGEPVLNRLVVHGLARPFIYSHLLLGYARPSGRKAVFVLVDY